ncbi:MAG: ATP-binding protein [Thermodesulfobacteriota bacterium]
MAEHLKSLQPTDSATAQIAFSWLLKLRWGAVICQLLLIAIVSLLFDIYIPTPILLAVIFFQICSNLYFHFLEKKRTPIKPLVFALIMAWDIVQLTLLIYFTGGPMNPFTFIYLVQVALAAILMQPGWAWALNIMTILCYALLFILPPAPDFNEGLVSSSATGSACGTDSSMALHLQGMWAAFAITAFFIVFFVSRIRKAMASHQQTLASLEDEKLRSEKMASLATLAAGAAHEFSTPLSTIAVAAGEMVHHFKDQGGDPDLIDDANLIKAEITKCRDILRQMAADAGEHLGESFISITLAEILDKVAAEFHNETGRKILFDLAMENRAVIIPLQTWLRTLRGLMKNAHDACPAGDIQGRVFIDNDYLAIAITDQGSGMSGDDLTRATEPFFTTKEPGKGLGLGLFLARSLAERFGGDLLIDSEPGQGSKVTFRVKLERIT